MNSEFSSLILYPSSLLRFLVIRVFTAASAELLELQTIRSSLLVLRRHVIAALAITALQYNVIAWHKSFPGYARVSRANFRKHAGGVRTRLLHNFRHSSRAHRASTFTNREAQTFLHRDRRDQLDLHLHVVARHHHLHSLRQMRHARHVRGPEVKLRAIAGEERRVPTAFFFRQYVSFSLEFRVRRDRARLRNH